MTQEIMLGRAPILGAMAAASDAGLPSARFYIEGGTQEVVDGLEATVLWPTAEWDDLGFSNDYITTGEFFPPADGEYLIIPFLQLVAEGTTTFPGGGNGHGEIITTDAISEQQSVALVTGIIPKFSWSGVHRLYVGTPFTILIVTNDAGTDSEIISGSLSVTRIRTIPEVS